MYLFICVYIVFGYRLITPQVQRAGRYQPRPQPRPDQGSSHGGGPGPVFTDALSEGGPEDP